MVISSGMWLRTPWRQIKMEGLPSHKHTFLLFHSQHVSAQICHHQVIREIYTSDERRRNRYKTTMLV
jgi:hypothetical protein